MNLRLLVWLGILLAVALAIWGLAGAFPGSMATDFELARLIWLFALLTLISSGIVFSRKIDLGETARNLAIWVGITAALVLVFTFQDELQFVWQRVRGELVPAYGVQAEPGLLVLSQSADGHFHIVGDVNGVPVDFLVDTGASDTVLSPADAMRAGYDVGSLDFSRVYQTANGFGTGAPLVLDRLAVGPIEFADFPASVNGAEMDSSLLGMSFLRRLDSFEVRGGQLYLRW